MLNNYTAVILRHDVRECKSRRAKARELKPLHRFNVSQRDLRALGSKEIVDGVTGDYDDTERRY